MQNVTPIYTAPAAKAAKRYRAGSCSPTKAVADAIATAHRHATEARA